MNLKVHQLLICITGSACRLHLMSSGSHSVSCVLSFTSNPFTPPNIIFPSMSLDGACFGMEKKNMTYLAAVTTLRGDPPHNKPAEFCSQSQIPLHIHYSWLDGGIERWSNLRAGWDEGWEGSKLELGELCDIDEKLWKRRSGVIYCSDTGADVWKI